ncbi:siroheme synthase [Neopusillimonas maritima]|uniref:precorrin-2 dehydrogenase n=1 Tax=Neopusillimonas maritima TaxID=2026239 RepID=A0A3A1YVI2_9BURK|nr:NAD(P)-dependent oxidoreductase [Neopusillimonas maritima]RIY41208.1 hypothetical protein CJP73_06635 [Neopusillimonas maritima]
MPRITPLYPIFADLAARPVLVVGGGAVAERKVRSLLNAGAEVHVGAPALTETLARWADERRLKHIDGMFQAQWLDNMWLVIAATNHREVNAKVKQAADDRGLLSNVVDDPALSSFQVPSVVDRAPLTIAISSAGVAPVLARRLRERMEAMFDHALADLAKLAGHYRAAIRHAYPNTGARRRFYDWLFDGPIPILLRQGKHLEAEQALISNLANPDTWPARVVTWIDPGPGDPGLLTLNGLRALNEADIVVHDSHIEEPLLSLARRDADRRLISGELLHHTEMLKEYLLKLFEDHQRVALVISNSALLRAEQHELIEQLSHRGVLTNIVRGVSAQP